MKINEVTAMPMGKVTTVTPAGTDPAKAIVSIKTADGKDIQTTADQLIQGPNNTYQLKTADVNQQGTNLKPGATITQAPTQGTAGATMGSETEMTTQEEVGGDPTDDYIHDIEDKRTKLTRIKKLAGLWKSTN